MNLPYNRSHFRECLESSSEVYLGFQVDQQASWSGATNARARGSAHSGFAVELCLASESTACALFTLSSQFNYLHGADPGSKWVFKSPLKYFCRFKFPIRQQLILQMYLLLAAYMNYSKIQCNDIQKMGSLVY